MLSESVTLTELVADGVLSNSELYVRKALAQMLNAGKLGTVSLRIGRRGKGVWPNYVLQAVPSESIIERYDGQTHLAWTGKDEHHKENWSNTTISGEDLYQLLHQVAIKARTPKGKAA